MLFAYPNNSDATRRRRGAARGRHGGRRADACSEVCAF
eukprot:gene37420-37630_t